MVSLVEGEDLNLEFQHNLCTPHILYRDCGYEAFACAADAWHNHRKFSLHVFHGQQACGLSRRNCLVGDENVRATYLSEYLVEARIQWFPVARYGHLVEAGAYHSL